MRRVVVIVNQLGGISREGGAHTTCELGGALAGEEADERGQELLDLAIVLQRSRNIDHVLARLHNIDGGVDGKGLLKHFQDLIVHLEVQVESLEAVTRAIDGSKLQSEGETEPERLKSVLFRGDVG